MRTRTRIKKDATPSNAPVFRLTDMVVEEVSAVDRAANKRTFLVVKSANGAPMPGEVTTGADGALTVAKAPTPEGAPTTPAESQVAPSSPEEPPVPTDTNPPEAPNGTTLRMSKEVKAELGARIVEAVKALGALGARVASAEEVDGVAEVPGELVEAIGGVVLALGAGVTKSADPIVKGRKQISMARESKIRAAHTALGEIVSELDAPAPTAEQAPEVAPAAPETAPAAKVDKRDAVIAGLVQTVERLAVQVGGIGTAITKQAQRLDDVARIRPTSNAAPIDDRASTTKRDSAPTSWPLDMNDGLGTVAGAPSDNFASR